MNILHYGHILHRMHDLLLPRLLLDNFKVV